MTHPKTRVLIHLTAHQYGGIETHVYHLAHLLVRHGFEVTLTSQRFFDLNGDWTRSLLSAGVVIVRPPRLARKLPSATGLILARAAVMLRLRPRSFDFVVGQGHGGAYRWAKRFVKRSGLFLWQEYWDGLPGKGDSYAGYHAPPAERLSWRMVRMIEALDGIVVGCERAHSNLLHVQGVKKPIRIVPPLTQIETGEITERRYDSDTELSVLMVGRLGRGKGIEVLLDLWPTLAIGPATLELYGDFEDSRLRAQVRSLAARDKSIRVHGGFKRQDLPNILASADLGLMLSIEEGYGLVACEYMAAGLPFIITDAGAAPEFTRQNPDAALVAVDATEIRGGIQQMAARIRKGETSRVRLAQHYEAGFSYGRIAARQLASFTDPGEFWADPA